MAYTDGAVHQLAGSGIVQVASPAGLRWHFSAVPGVLGSRATVPRRYIGLGSFALGDAAALGYHVPLELVDQLVYPLADGVVRVSYDLAAGAAATLTELVGPPGWAKGQVFDRNPIPVSQTALSWNPASNPATSAFVYTVPAGKRLQLASASVHHVRVGAVPAASLNTGMGGISIDGVNWLVLTYIGYQVNQVQDVYSGPLFLRPGDIIRGQFSNAELSGGLYTTLSFSGTLFDA